MRLSLRPFFSAALFIIALQGGLATAQETPPILASRAGLPTNFDQVFTHRYAGANGIRLHYVVGGPADGPMAVLLHGWPQTWYTWRRVTPALAEAGYRVVVVDYRGAGESEKPAGGYDEATMAADFRALVRGLRAARINLVGRDIGVMVAYAYAAQWPDEVAKLVMLDVPIPATRTWNEAKSRPDPELWHFGLHQQATSRSCSSPVMSTPTSPLSTRSGRTSRWLTRTSRSMHAPMPRPEASALGSSSTGLSRRTKHGSSSS